jgi:DNA polymerase III epsilon subunit family exonuclease
MDDLYQRDWRTLKLVAFDTETTGLDPKKGGVIEFGAVLFDAGKPVKFFNRLIDPKRRIEPGAMKAHGITDEQVAGRPQFGELADNIQNWLTKAGPIWCAFNDGFDRGFIDYEFKRIERPTPMMPTIDPLVWARFIWAGLPCNLDSVAQRLQVVIPPEVRQELGDDGSGRHRAIYDAAVAGYCLYALERLMPKTLRQTLYVQDYLYRWSLTKNGKFKRDYEPTMPPEHRS